MGASAQQSSTDATSAASRISSVIASPPASVGHPGERGFSDPLYGDAMHCELVDKLQRTAVTPTLSCGVAPSLFLRLAQLGLAQLTLALAARNSTKIPREEVVDGGTLGCHSIVDIGKRGPGYTIGTARSSEG